MFINHVALTLKNDNVRSNSAGGKSAQVYSRNFYHGHTIGQPYIMENSNYLLVYIVRRTDDQQKR